MKQINHSPKVGKGVKKVTATATKAKAPVVQNKVHEKKWVLPSTGKTYSFKVHATSPSSTASAIENYNHTRSGGHVRAHIQWCIDELSNGKDIIFTHNGKAVPANKVEFDEVFELKSIASQDKSKMYVRSYAWLQYLSPAFQYTVSKFNPSVHKKIINAPKINSKTENPMQYIVVPQAGKKIQGNKIDITEFGIYCENRAIEKEIFFEYASTNFIRRIRWEISPYHRSNGREKGHPVYNQLTNQ